MESTAARKQAIIRLRTQLHISQAKLGQAIGISQLVQGHGVGGVLVKCCGFPGRARGW